MFEIIITDFSNMTVLSTIPYFPHPIYLFQNLQANQRKGYTKGNAHFELLFKYNSTIEYLGDFNKKSLKVKKISFNDLPHKPGKISIKGYLRSAFEQVSKTNTTEYFSSITDGRYKLDITLRTDSDSINIERGSHLEIIGELDYSDKSLVLNIAGLDNIKILSSDKMSIDDIIRGNIDVENE
ncbi:hypothetical protein TKK_0011220 [Trichogramma kaykai]